MRFRLFLHILRRVVYLFVSHMIPLLLNVFDDLHVDVISQVQLRSLTTSHLGCQEKTDLGPKPQKHAIKNCNQTVSCALPRGEYERGAIPPVDKLICFLLICLFVIIFCVTDKQTRASLYNGRLRCGCQSVV